MARWKLAAPHYLNVDGTKWEYQEVSRQTGKTVRLQVSVPLYLDPRDPADFTHKWGRDEDNEGEIIVCHAHLAHDSRDVAFLGDPTPDMIPIDDEAKEISASFAERWRYKPEVEAPGSFSQSLIDKFQIAMSDIQTKPAHVEGLDLLVNSIAEMVKSNQELTKSFIRRTI